jgi:predicted phosphodiesterase
MVARVVKFFAPVLLGGAFFLVSCNVDVFGMIASSDLAERWQARNTFKLLTPADRSLSLGDNYSFIVLSDTHIENGDAHGLEKLKNAIDSGVAFVVVNGDITQGGHRKDLEKFIDIAKSLGVPCYPVAGNHDIYFGNWPVWKELIGSTAYRIDGGGTTLFMLDSANAYFGADQLDWLEQGIKKAKGRVFVFSHVNLFVKSPADEQQFTDIRERARVTSLLTGRCDAMFTGHVHKRIIEEAGGVRYITTEDFRSSSAYCRVSVSKDGVRWEFKTL